MAEAYRMLIGGERREAAALADRTGDAVDIADDRTRLGHFHRRAGLQPTRVPDPSEVWVHGDPVGRWPAWFS